MAVVPSSLLGMRHTHPSDLSLTGLLPITVYIRNLGDVEVPVGAEVRFKAGVFYEEDIYVLKTSIQKTQEHSFTHSLRASGNASLDTIPSVIFVTVFHPTSKLPFQQTYSGFKFGLYRFMGDIINWKPAYPKVASKARILVVGPAGHGKSTLINHFHSLYDLANSEVAPILSDADHVTVKNKTYAAVKAPNIEFLDTVGMKETVEEDDEDQIALPPVTAPTAVPSVTSIVPSAQRKLTETPLEDNYDGGAMQAIVTGQLPPDFSVLDGNNRAAVAECIRSHTPDTEMHAAIVVVTYSLRNDKAKKKAMVKKYVRLLTRLNMNPMVVVTNIDKSKSDVRAGLISEFETVTGVNGNKIFLLNNKPLNIDKPGTPDFVQDDDVEFVTQRRTLYLILKRAIANCTLTQQMLHDGSVKIQYLAPSASAADRSVESLNNRTNAVHLGGATKPANQSAGAAKRSQAGTMGMSSKQQPSAGGSANGIASPSNRFSLQWTDGTSIGDVYGAFSATSTLAAIRRLIDSQQFKKLQGRQFAFVSSESGNEISFAQESFLTFVEVAATVPGKRLMCVTLERADLPYND